MCHTQVTCVTYFKILHKDNVVVVVRHCYYILWIKTSCRMCFVKKILDISKTRILKVACDIPLSSFPRAGVVRFLKRITVLRASDLFLRILCAMVNHANRRCTSISTCSLSAKFVCFHIFEGKNRS